MAEGERSGPLWGTTLVAELEALTSDLALSDYDLLLVGDGSGTINQKSCGWACVAWEKATQKVTVHNGVISCGTNNFAELFPYVQALWYYNQSHKDMLPPAKKFKVQIVSDSEVTVRCGNKQYTRKSNACLWAGIEWFENCGLYEINWTHVYRNTNKFSKKCDWLAGETRVSLDNLRRKLLKEEE